MSIEFGAGAIDERFPVGEFLVDVLGKLGRHPGDVVRTRSEELFECPRL
jgi:hypothetical protein